MSGDLHSEFPQEKLILRDHLAIDRTILANERTFLAYIRTALALFAAGAFSIRFFNSILLEITGWMFVVLGVIVVVIGKKRYRETKKLIDLEVKNERTARP